MQIRYYKYGDRPIVEEIDNEGLSTYYAYQWKTGDFKEDMTYFRKITHDLPVRPMKWPRMPLTPMWKS